MKTAKTLGLTFVLLAGILSGACAEGYRTDINPALLYYRAFLVAPRDGEHIFQYLDTNTWDRQQLPEEFGSSVSNFDAELKFIRVAAHQNAPCDWGIDLSPGPETLAPHLATAKQAVIASQFQIIWALQNGNQAEARDDLLGDLFLGRNISRPYLLVSSLVQMAIERYVCATIAENFYQFTPGTLRELADGTDTAPPRGTVAECVSSEKIFRNWYLAKLKSLKKQFPDNNSAAMDELHGVLYYYTTNDWEQLTNAGGGTIDGISQEVRDSGPLFAKLETLMTMPYSQYREQSSQFQSEFMQSGNAFFLQYLSGWENSRNREFAAEVDLAMARAAIEYKLQGEAGLKSVADPCGNGPFGIQRFYLNGVDRGFELTSQLPRGKGAESIIFVEKGGPDFNVMGDNVGQPYSKQ